MKFATIPVTVATIVAALAPVASADIYSDIEPYVSGVIGGTVEGMRTAQEPITITIVNNLNEVTWPAFHNTDGTGPVRHGFLLRPKMSVTQFASYNWNGRFWNRRGCGYYHAVDGAKKFWCGTGDCNGEIDCKLSGEPPHTIAEFNFSDPLLLAWFNLSLVDGYNEDLAIIPEGRPDLAIIARAPKNGMCSPDLEFPLPGPVLKQPCLSACQRWGRPEDCCTGEFATPDKCKHSAQSLWWKGLFPEAYCYAYDDSSVRTTSAGRGFTIVIGPDLHREKLSKYKRFQ